jgi:hypothetical protein
MPRLTPERTREFILGISLGSVETKERTWDGGLMVSRGGELILATCIEGIELSFLE